MAVSNEDFVRQFVGLWATREADKMAAMFSDDGVYDNVPYKKPMKGRLAIKAWLDRCFEHLSHIDVAILTMATHGEWVLSERLDTHVIDGRDFPLPVMNACRIVDGKIMMFRDYFDRQTVADLGMV